MRNESGIGTLSFAIIIALVQGLDVFIHLVSDQIEPARIIGTVALLTGLIGSRFLSAKLGTWLLVLSIGVYLSLNGWFVLENGLINSESGEPRGVLILIVTVTTLLSVFYSRVMIARDRK
jgi:membrane-bound ClpP family serine protease